MKLILGPIKKEKEFEFKLIPFKNGLTVNGFLKKFNQFGVYLSGGLDSTIFLCILLNELKSINKLNEVDLYCFTICKTDGATYYTNRIIKKINDFYEIKLNHISNIENPFIDITPTPLNGGTMEQISIQHKKMLFFTGLHADPNPQEKNFKFKNMFSKINHEIFKNLRIISPFNNLYKYHILDLYYKLNLEILIPYTYSCVNHPSIPCNNCAGCEERSWSFQTLNKEDPGTLPPDINDITFNNTWKYFKDYI